VSDASDIGIQMETSDPSRLVTDPLVSVLMIVYNHAPYLPEAIEGIVSQRCPHAFELIIGEDRSTDGSFAIVLDYQQRFPEIIRVIHSPSNVGMNANSRRVRAAARGKYLAWCEGDDYWCSRSKLAEQAALLNSNADVGAVHTDWVLARLVAGEWSVAWNRSVHRRVPDELLAGRLLSVFHHPKLLRTCTLMFRKCIADEVDGSVFGKREYTFGDTVTSLFITSNWCVAYVPKVTAVYRQSPRSALRSGTAARISFLRSSLNFDTDARAYLPPSSPYPSSYRWELGVGLMLWSMRARDWSSFVFALRDLGQHFSALEFLAAGCKTVWMRRPRFGRTDGTRMISPACNDSGTHDRR